jgi:hypothetical protein
LKLSEYQKYLTLKQAKAADATKGQEISKAIYDVKTSSKKQTKLTILSKEDGQDSEIRSCFGRSFDIINCF